MKVKKEKTLKLNEKGGNSTKSNVKWGLVDILERVESLVAELQYDVAYKFCVRALELQPNNESALCVAGQVLLELERPEPAKLHFEKAIKVCPDSGYTKYLHMGQLSDSETSLQMYEKGLELMLAIKEKCENRVADNQIKDADEPEVTDRDVSEVYCAMAELYLTDLCELENAEQKCENLIQKAINADKSNAYAQQTMASFKISCSKPEEAIEYLKSSLEVWLPLIKAAISEAETEEGPSQMQFECDLDFEKRKACTRLLLETELWDEADGVLDILIAELDSDPEVWYLSGLRHYLCNPPDFEQVDAYFQQSKELAADETQHKAMVSHMNTLLKEIKETKESKMDST